MPHHNHPSHSLDWFVRVEYGDGTYSLAGPWHRDGAHGIAKKLSKMFTGWVAIDVIKTTDIVDIVRRLGEDEVEGMVVDIPDTVPGEWIGGEGSD